MTAALAFTNIGMLVALAALPVIWYFLRLMPPKPRLEQFPPTRLLLEIARKEEQPARSPWWLTALRLLLCAAVIAALAGPVFKPTGEVAPGSGPLLLVVDNGWSSSPRWPQMLETAQRVIRLAEDAGRPVALLATAEPPNQSLVATDSNSIRKRIEALTPRPWAAKRAEFVAPLTEAASKAAYGGVAWVSDGLGGAGVDTFARFLSDTSKDSLVVYADGNADLYGLKPPIGTGDALTVPVIRRAAAAAGAGLITARDIRGRVIGDTPFSFPAGETAAEAKLTLPIEIRNEIVRVEVTGAETAGSVQLLDDRWRRRRIGLLSGSSAEAAQPLLSPLYYISRAVQPFADIREPRDANAAVAVPDLIDANSSVIAMADIGKLPADIEEQVGKWVRDGGVLVRFAGPRLAAATDALIPVNIRHGDRTLGGSLSWQTPQPLATFSDKSPFAGLPVPEDILVNRQVLAQPDGTLSERTWAALADGTPLVTAAQQGKGWLILFHVTADTSWSNLPLSGTFVEMLRRIIAFSASAGSTTEAGTVQSVPPYRLLDGRGHFTTPTAEARPLAGDISAIEPGLEHPPGLYGSESGFRALNLLNDKATLPTFDISSVATASVRPYPTATPTELGPWLIALAVILLMLDALAVLWLGGGLRMARRRAAPAAAAIALSFGLIFQSGQTRADEASDKAAMDAVGKTHLAYIITGNSDIDNTSRAGLSGLSQMLKERTALEPGDPIGVNPDRDELAFFPLLYWPIVPDTAMPSPATMARLDAYMRQGGSVLFDTRDQLERSATPNSFSGTPAVERLRDMLANLDIPPLQPVPADHVLTKAFYLLTDFPGRYSGGPLWVQASEVEEADRADRPVAAGDGVSTILITENDFAGAWARDKNGSYIFPTVPTDPLQREMAYRVGINIVMYTLTGNYKADQVHVPALLEAWTVRALRSAPISVSSPRRRPGPSGRQPLAQTLAAWIPAFAGMTSVLALALRNRLQAP